jgi:hypothetical protein
MHVDIYIYNKIQPHMRVTRIRNSLKPPAGFVKNLARTSKRVNEVGIQKDRKRKTPETKSKRNL